MRFKLKTLILLFISVICIFFICTSAIKRNYINNIKSEIAQLFTDPVERWKIVKYPHGPLRIRIIMHTQLDEDLCTSVNNVRNLIENYNPKILNYIWGDFNNLEITVSNLSQGPEYIRVEYTRENQNSIFQPQNLYMDNVYELKCLKKIDDISNVSQVLINQVFYHYSLDGIQELTNLQKLHFDTGNPSINLSYLSELNNLTEIAIETPNGIDDLSPICNLKSLRELIIWGECDESQIKEIKKSKPDCRISVR